MNCIIRKPVHHKNLTTKFYLSFVFSTELSRFKVLLILLGNLLNLVTIVLLSFIWKKSVVEFLDSFFWLKLLLNF